MFLFSRDLFGCSLAPPARACVGEEVIDRLLAADGLLFIGHADRLEKISADVKFVVDGDPAYFAYRRAIAVMPPFVN